MEKSTILLLFLGILLVGILMFFTLDAVNITGNIVSNYTFTKAICDDDNLCQDYEIICQNTTVVDMIPITGAVVQFSGDWNDPRTEEQINRLCN